MGRHKGSQNKEPQRTPETIHFTTEQRIEFLANLIVDSITEDQDLDEELLKRIKEEHAAITTA